MVHVAAAVREERREIRYASVQKVREEMRREGEARFVQQWRAADEVDLGEGTPAPTSHDLLTREKTFQRRQGCTTWGPTTTGEI